MKRRHAIATGAAVVILLVGVTVAFRQYARAQAKFDSNTIVAATPSTTLITSPGSYRYDGLGLILKVWVDAGGLVQYDLSGSDGAPLGHSSERASAYSRWAFVIDEKKRLWFYSGDVGTFLWDGSADISRPLSKDDPFRNEMPQTLEAYAPRA